MPHLKNVLLCLVLLSSVAVATPPQFNYQGDKLILTVTDFAHVSSTVLRGYITLDLSNFKKFHIKKNWILIVDETMTDMKVQIVFPAEVEIEKDKKFKNMILYFPYASQKSSAYALLR